MLLKSSSSVYEDSAMIMFLGKGEVLTTEAILLYYSIMFLVEGWRFYSYIILALCYLKKKKNPVLLVFLNYFITKSLLYLKPDTSKIHCIFVIFYYFTFSLWKIDVLIIMKILWWFITFLAHFFLKHMLTANIGRILNK